MNTALSETLDLNFSALRQRLLEHALAHDFENGLLPARDTTNFFGYLLTELEFAAWAACEWADPSGSHYENPQLLLAVINVLEGTVIHFQPEGIVTPTGDGNTAYFALCPITLALRRIRNAIPADRFESLLEKCIRLYNDAATHINRTHDYLNPRAMEAAVACNLYRLTGEERFLERSTECLDELVKRQYSCGAQPYHTGGWIWGRRPAQVYQFLSGAMMLYAGRDLQRDDVVDYVYRMMDYQRYAVNNRGEPHITPFEAINKCYTSYTMARQWPLAAALGEECSPLARTSYEPWAKYALLLLGNGGIPPAPSHYTCSLFWTGMLGVHDIPCAPAFTPPAGIRVLPDISTAFVHEAGLDLTATLLTGYSAFVQADCGSLRLFAMTFEVAENPTHRTFGTDAVRTDWQKPTEQMACESDGHSLLLRGRVYTKWDTPEQTRDERLLHSRELEVSLAYANNELLLEFKTLHDKRIDDVPGRLLFLLGVHPPEATARITIHGESRELPEANSPEEFFWRKEIGTLEVVGADGCGIQIVPEDSQAQWVLVEKPLNGSKPANEGCIRISFEGRQALQSGRFKVRFSPGILL